MEDAGPFSNWAATLALGLILAVLIGGFSVAAYLTPGRRPRRPFVQFILRYAIVFISLLLLEAAFLWLVPSVHDSMRHATTVVVSWMVGLAGVRNSVLGSTLTLQDRPVSFEIDVACLGGILFWSYIAMILAETGATLRQQAVGLAAGCAALAIFNLSRIAASVYVEWHSGVNIHNWFYLLNMAFVLVAWAVWVRAVRPGSAPAVRRAEPECQR